MDLQELKKRLADYRFYHNIELGEGVRTPGILEHVASQQPVLKAIQDLDLPGKRVLDLGCRDGLYSFAAEKRGAAEVIGIDNNLSKGAVELIIPFLKSSVKMVERNLYDVAPAEFGTFDVIIFAGLLYHLRYPMWGLKVVRDLCGPNAKVLIETAIFYGLPKLPLLYCPADDGPYTQTSRSFFNKKGLLDSLKSIGFRVLSWSPLHPEEEALHRNDIDPVVDRVVVLCEPGPVNTELDRYFNKTHTLFNRS